MVLAAPAAAQTAAPGSDQPATEAPAERFFAQGVAAFRKRDYDRARQYFELALDAGMSDAALHYNLGVTYYKLGQYEPAGQHFRVAGSDPAWAPLAWYNAGLAANRQGDEAAARHWFERTLTVAQDTRLRSLANTALDRLDGAGPESRWSGFAMVNLGYDDNVALSADGEVIVGTGEADQFAELYGQANWDGAGRLAGLGAYAGLYLLKYQELDDFDITNLSLAANWGTPVANWHTTIEGRFEYLWQGDRSVQRVLTLAAEGYPVSGALQPLLLGYELSRIDDEDPAYEPLNGWRHRLLARYLQQLQRWRLRYEYLFEYNDRQDLDLGTEFYSESPLRNALRVRASLALPANWQASGRLEYRRSDFSDPDRRADGTEATRRDNRWDLTLELSWSFARPWELAITYNRTDNASNFNEFDYTRNVYFVGVTRPF